MTRLDARKCLDSMLPPFERNKKSINANKNLKKTQEGKLLDIVVGLERVEQGRYQEEYDLDGALETIAKIAKKHETVLPFLIKQVLFYLSCRYLHCCRCETEEEKMQCRLYEREQRCEIPQGAFLKKLEKYQWFVSHNFFSRMGITPESYVLTKEHKQVKPPFPYPGQKKAELGVAIRYLAYQSGNYSKYVDVFGGSGAACSAIPKKDRVTYYYNEENCLVENLFSVLADDELHQELISALENIVNYIQGKEFFYEDVDFEEEILKFNDKTNEISKQEKRLRSENPTEFEMDYDGMWNFLQRFREDVEEQEADFIFVCDEYEYTKQELLEASETVAAFLTHYRVLIEYDEKYMKGTGLCKMKGDAEGKSTNLYDKNKQYTQYRCYCLYAYFSNLRREKDEEEEEIKCNRVKYAVAEFYFLSFVTNGTTGVSPILQMLKKEKKEEYNSVLKFLKMDFRKEIEAFHKEIRRFQCSQKDFHDVFMEMDDNNTLFYVDAPYAEMKDYTDPENKEKAFSEEQRKQLLEDMRNAKGKVIYSCRAAKTSKSMKYSQEELQKINIQIAKQTFGPFFDNVLHEKRKWYVLVIEKEENLDRLLAQDKIVEVMLTNFEIQSFEVEGKKNVRFKVYEMLEFMQILLNHIVPGIIKQKND